MTEQAPEKFINDHPLLDVSGFYLWYVTAELPVQPISVDNQAYTTEPWRGCVPTWHLRADGTLTLVQIAVPRFDEQEDIEYVLQPVENGLVSGDFELIFRRFVGPPNQVIPFRDGRLCEDQALWITEKNPVEVEVSRVIKGGLLVYCKAMAVRGFIPRSWLPAEAKSNLHRLIGRRYICQLTIDDKRRNCIFRPLTGLESG